MRKFSDGTLIFPPSTDGKSFMTVAASSQTEMTVEQMKARISPLSDEIDTNEEENRAMQQEIVRPYAKIDAQKA